MYLIEQIVPYFEDASVKCKNKICGFNGYLNFWERCKYSQICIDLVIFFVTAIDYVKSGIFYSNEVHESTEIYLRAASVF